MAILRNKYFDSNPLEVIFKWIGKKDNEGWRSFSLSIIHNAPAKRRTITECSGTMSCSSEINDIDLMADTLRSVITKKPFKEEEFSPIEPYFLLRARRRAEDETELTWIIDEGFNRNIYSSDTGVGALIVVTSDAIEKFLEDLKKDN